MKDLLWTPACGILRSSLTQGSNRCVIFNICGSCQIQNIYDDGNRIEHSTITCSIDKLQETLKGRGYL